jgi:hypothetical protein
VADLGAQRPLGRVLGLGPDKMGRKRPQVSEGLRRCPPPLRPEVPRILRMTAKLQGDEMVFLVVSWQLVR